MKKKIYIFLTMFLGFLLGTNASFLTETWLIKSALAQDRLPTPHIYFNEYSYISPYISLAMVIIGIVLGFLAGRRWRKIAYVEKAKARE